MKKRAIAITLAFLLGVALTWITASGCDCYDSGERCWDDSDCCSGSCYTPDPVNWPSISYCS